MKNIHVLPTDKSSRLSIKDAILILHRLQWRKGTHHIYITSDEEIKEGDWYLVELFNIEGKSKGLHIEKCTKLDDVWCNNFDAIATRHKNNCKKIILTTDQDLIKDGVQAIDDDFLEWFVKNPSCEWVEVEIESKFDRVDGHYHDVWEIIIPKEEPKQDLLHKCTCLRPQTNCFSGMCSYCNRQIVKNLTTEDLKQKQETLEEAINQELENHFFSNNSEIKQAEYFINFGAKWQQEQERMYSDKEVKHLMTLAFEQGFKKADVVEAGLEAKETDTEVNWIFLKHKK